MIRALVSIGLLGLLFAACGGGTDSADALPEGSPDSGALSDELEGRLLAIEGELEQARSDLDEVEAERDELAEEVAVLQAGATQPAVESTNDAEPTPTPTPTPAPVAEPETADSCQSDETVEFLKDLTNRHLRFVAIENLAGSTARVGLAGPVGDMIDEKQELVEMEDVPPCAEAAWKSHKTWFVLIIEGYQFFMQQMDDNIVAATLKVADDTQAEAARLLKLALEEAGLPVHPFLAALVTAAETPVPTATPAPSLLEVTRLGGEGDETTETFQLKDGLASIDIAQDGAGHITVWLVESASREPVELLIDDVVEGTFSTAVRLDWVVVNRADGNFILEVEADGPWEVTITQ